MIQRLTDMKRRGEGGFTLIELLVVIIILGVLSAIVVFAVRGTGDKGKASAVKIDERTIRTAEEAFCGTFGQYGTGDQLIGEAAAPDGAKYKFLSNKPEYHTVFAVQNGGRCNGWSYAISPTPSGLETTSGRWTDTPGYSPTFATDTMVDLPSGKILAVGKRTTDFSPAAQIYDPADNTWSPAATPPGVIAEDGERRSFILLNGTFAECGGNCGKVLGFLRGASTDANRWRLYDPAGGGWSTLPYSPGSYSSNGCCGVKSAVQLTTNCGPNCGKVLITANDGTRQPSNAELYNPFDNSFEQIPNSQAWTNYDDMIRLRDGRVLMLSYQCGATCTGAAELFDPALKAIKPSAVPGTAQVNWGGPLPAVLPNGDVLSPHGFFDYPAGDIYHPDPSGGPGQWSTVSTCAPDPSSQWCNTLAALPDGRVLAATARDLTYSGQQDGQTYLFDPINQKWYRTGDLLHPPDGANWAVALPGGKVLAAGWGTAEVFTP